MIISKKDAILEQSRSIIDLLNKRVDDLEYIVNLQKKIIPDLQQRKVPETFNSLPPLRESKPRRYSDFIGSKPELIHINPIDTVQDKEKTRTEITTHINPKKLPIGVLNLRQNSKGDVFINCSNNKSAAALLNETKEVLGDKYTATITPKFNPRLKVMNADPGDLGEESFREASSRKTS
jgi:hypothetical protein